MSAFGITPPIISPSLNGNLKVPKNVAKRIFHMPNLAYLSALKAIDTSLAQKAVLGCIHQSLGNVLVAPIAVSSRIEFLVRLRPGQARLPVHRGWRVGSEGQNTDWSISRMSQYTPNAHSNRLDDTSQI